MYNRGGSMNSLSWFFFWSQVNRTKGWTPWRRCGSRFSRSQAPTRKPAAKSLTRRCALAKAWAALQSNRTHRADHYHPQSQTGSKMSSIWKLVLSEQHVHTLCTQSRGKWQRFVSVLPSLGQMNIVVTVFPWQPSARKGAMIISRILVGQQLAQYGTAIREIKENQYYLKMLYYSSQKSSTFRPNQPVIMKDSNAEVQNVTLGNTIKKETWQKIVKSRYRIKKCLISPI